MHVTRNHYKENWIRQHLLYNGPKKNRCPKKFNNSEILVNEKALCEFVWHKGYSIVQKSIVWMMHLCLAYTAVMYLSIV